MRALVASVTIALLALAGCGNDDEPVATANGSTTQPVVETTVPAADDDQARLEAARRRWASAGPDDYLITWSVQCFCPRTAFVDTVVGGEVVDHREAPDSEAFEDPGPKTMEAVFDEVQAAIDLEPFSLEVVYDDDTGAVRSYFVDEVENMADEEHGLEVEVEPLEDGPPEVGSPEVALDELTQPYGCGYGFQIGRPDQRVALFARHPGGPAASGTVTLPAEAWSLTVRFGEDLFANWCDDVMEPGEPEPVVTQEWQVVEGTLEVTAPAEGAPGRATLVATGLVAERPDGERVPLGDIAIANDSYGTVAG